MLTARTTTLQSTRSLSEHRAGLIRWSGDRKPCLQQVPSWCHQPASNTRGLPSGAAASQGYPSGVFCILPRGTQPCIQPSIIG
jgi:hypothetical protein